MKFTRLRLLGFKSFVEPTDFLIEPGLTGVVGPNGCGKSNLVEALRWVMGETSHKSLRAADMDDVIFSGTNNRPGRNNAEVAIHIDNSTRKAPAQFNDHDALDISRRIEREAGSTYRINGREVRARDVHILFADASTGSRSPSMVHQGRIGEIIQAKPEQRRRVLEEAAGISGLHARRHEAELRLRAAEQNLARLEDVINQLAGQIDSLKKQARQAIRYRTVAEQVRKAEAMLLHLRWVAANAELAEAEHAKNAAVRVVAERTGQQAEASKRQALAAAALPALRETEARAAAALQRITMAREALDREEARATERMAELDRRLVQLADDIERERRLAADAQSALARLAAEEETLDREAEVNDERRAGADKRVAEADAVLARSEKAGDELTATLADLTARRNALENAMREHGERAARLADEIAAVEAELAEISAAERADLAPLSAAAEAAQEAAADGETAAVRAEAAHSAARQALDAARGPLGEAERRTQRLETEGKTLAKLLHVDTKKLWPPALDQVTVDKGYEAALGAALGDDLEAPIDPSAPMRWTGANIDASDPALPDGVKPLGDHVNAPQQLRRRLAQIGVINREAAARLVPLLKPGQRLVSREGDLWRWDGFSVAADAPAGAARRLAGKNRLADIEAEFETVRREVENKQAAVTAAETETASAATAETDARVRWRALQQEAQTARDRHAEAERQAGRNAARLSALGEAKTRLSASREEAMAGRNEAQRALTVLPPAASIETQLAAARGDIEGKRARLAELRADAQALAREAEISARRLAAISADREAWSARKDGAATQIETLQARVVEAKIERLRRERERLGAVNLRAEEELREVETQHGSLASERDDLVEAIKRLRQGIQNLNREARERLLASFELVSKHFKHLFTELFGGGTAELQLVEHEDPLEAGLEIVAKPPGKKPATLSLLSGGEQALTALALIFAVFLTNPAPICVLDEVDAPLDDHNIERFCDLLDEMTRLTATRFVIITHYPITMARMNRLYGVTMAERGVSQLVSVDLEGAVKLREAV